MLTVISGIILSELQRHYGVLKNFVLHNFLLWDTPYGALTPLYAGTSPEGKDFNGMVRVLIYPSPFPVVSETSRKALKNRFETPTLWNSMLLMWVTVSHTVGSCWKCAQRDTRSGYRRKALVVARGENERVLKRERNASGMNVFALCAYSLWNVVLFVV